MSTHKNNQSSYSRGRKSEKEQRLGYMFREKEEGWLLVGVVQEGEVMPSADLMGCLPQAEVVHGYLCCHLGERVGLKRRYSAFSVLFGYFWLSCLHFHRV